MTHYITINHHHGLIACFSPKCACTTLRNWFKHTLSAQDIENWQRVEKHTTWPGDIDNYPDYTRIFFIRDPFRRLVSFYCHWVVRDDRNWCFADNQKNYSLREKSFSDFIHTLEELSGRGIDFQHHLKPQMRNVEGVAFDLVVAVEDLRAQLRLINQELGIDYAVKELNATSYDEAMTAFVYDAAPESLAQNGFPMPQYFYNPELIKKVERFYRDDLECYREFHEEQALFERHDCAQEPA